MRPLSSTLLAEQKKPTAIPYCKVEIRDRRGGATRLDWERLYVGSEPDYFHSATILGNGSLIRLRADPSTHILYFQRVTSPNEASDFSQWQDFSPGKLNFDGIDDYAEAPDTPSLNPNYVTIEFWGKVITRNTDWLRFVDKPYTSTTHPWVQYSAHLYGDTMKPTIEISIGGANYMLLDSELAISVTQGVRFHFAGIFDGSEIAVYINGELSGQKSAPGVLGNWGMPLGLARYFTQYSNVSLDEVRIYSRALSLEEIRNNMRGNITTDGLILWYNFDELSGSTLYDHSGKNNNATIYHATWQKIGIYANALTSIGSEVLAFAVTDEGYYQRRESKDSGVTWGDWIDMGYIGNNPTAYRLSSCFKGNQDALILITDGSAVWRRKRIAGSWETAAKWTNSLQSISGISCFHAGDWNIAITGVNPNNKKGIWTCLLGDGYSASLDTWTSLKDIMLAEGDSNLEFKSPSLDFPDVFRLWFVEKYNGNQGYERLCFSYSLPTAEFISNLWREPIPFNLVCKYGVAMAHYGSYAWLSTPYGVWRASLNPASLEVTSDVVSLHQVITDEEKPSSLEVELDNSAGKYANFNKLGSEILVNPGYKTSQGDEVSPGPSFWIEGWEYKSEKGRSSLALYAIDAWGLLKSWKARRQIQWQSGERNIYQLLSFIFSRAGLELSSFSYSSHLVNQKPAFTIHPGQSGLNAVRRLVGMVQDRVLFREAKAFIKNPQTSDATDYSYGIDHPIFEGIYSYKAGEINWAQVYGDNLMVEEFQWQEIDKVYDRLEQEIDGSLPSLTRAQERAQTILRQSSLKGEGKAISVPVNCGQELWDVVEITDSRVGLVAKKFRVLGLELNFIPASHYRLKISLGGL